MARGMAAYVNDGNSTENVVCVASNGNSVVHHTLSLGSSKGWQAETVATDNHPQSDVAAFAFPIQNTEHILYVDANGNLIELLRQSPAGGLGSWQKKIVDQNLMMAPPSPLTAWLSPYCRFNIEHWVYAANKGGGPGPSWFEHFYVQNSVSETVQGPLVNSGYNPPQNIYYPSVVSYVDPGGYEHVVYLTALDDTGVNIGLIELYRYASDPPGDWNTNQFENLPPPLISPNGGLVGYAEAESGTQHIFMLSSFAGGTVRELFFTGPPWKYGDPRQSSGGQPPLMNGQLAGHDWPQDRTIHVFYINSGGEVWELYEKYGGPPWFSNDLTFSAVNGIAPLAQTTEYGTPFTSFVWPLDGSQHVVYIGVPDNNIYELWYKQGNWNFTMIGPW